MAVPAYTIQDEMMKKMMNVLYSQRGGQIVLSASENAVRLGRHRVDASLLLLELLQYDDAVSVIVLRNIGCAVDQVRLAVEKIVTNNTEDSAASEDDGMYRLTEDARELLSIASQEAKIAGDKYVGTEHELLGVLGLVKYSNFFASYEVTAERVREEIRAISEGNSNQHPA